MPAPAPESTRATAPAILFRKMQGIPFSARRTRVLKQDPNNPGTVYAGTTEGLWKTADAGKTWKRVSNPEVVVNDVLVDPRNSNRVLLATDRSGVLASDNGAQTFVASNHGYAHRYVSSILADQNDPNSILVGVVNDREFGGVFSTRDGGQSWQQKSAGLGGRDVFALQQTSTGGLIAGTNKGIFLLDRNASQWRPINTIVTEKSAARVVKGKKGKKAAKVPAVVVRSVLDARVSDIEVTPKRWLAATSCWTVHQLGPGQNLDRRSGDGQELISLRWSRTASCCRRHSHQRSLLFEQWSDLAAGAAVFLHHQHSRRGRSRRKAKSWWLPAKALSGVPIPARPGSMS